MVDKVREARLRLFKHVKKRCSGIKVRTCERLTLVDLNEIRGTVEKKMR